MENTIKDYRSLQAMMRSYDHQSWHAVNVKRYHDYIKPDEIEREAERLTSNKNILPSLIEYGQKISEDYHTYYQWLGDCSDMLKEDIERSGLFSLKYIKQQGDKYKTHIYQLGRSGGWICFQDTAEGLADDIEAEEYDGYYGSKEEMEAELTEAVNEIEALKDFIKKYNAGLSWRDEVFYRMSEKLEELKEEEADRLEDLRNEKEAIKNRDITTMTLGSLLSHDNEAVKRNAIGILKQLNKKN